MRGSTETLGAILLVIGSASGASGQTLLASELGSVSQVVDGTKVTVEYSRPRARGRTGLFGGEVKFGHVWTPGANRSTTLAVSKDVSINGHAVPKGKYSVWMVVAPRGLGVGARPRHDVVPHGWSSTKARPDTIHGPERAPPVHGGAHLVVSHRAAEWHDADHAMGHRVCSARDQGDAFVFDGSVDRGRTAIDRHVPLALGVELRNGRYRCDVHGALCGQPIACDDRSAGIRRFGG